MVSYALHEQWDLLQEASSTDFSVLAPDALGRLSFPEFKESQPVRVKAYETISSVTTSPAEKLEALRMLKALNGLRQLVENSRTGTDNTLYAGQIPVVESVLRNLESGETSGYINLPTRSGKTVIFAKIAEAMGMNAAVLEPTKDLVHQTAEKFEAFTPDFKTRKLFGEKKERGSAPVTLSTYHYYLNASKRGEIAPGQFPLIILDEAHESLSPARAKLVRQHCNHSIVIGFTATPEYSEKKNVAKLLGKEFHNMSIQEAAEWGMIAPFTVISAETDIDLTSVESNWAGDYSDADLERALNTTALNKSTVELYLARFKGQAGFVYCSTKVHAEEMAKEFRRHHVKATHMIGDFDSDERREILRELQSGELDIVTNVKLATRGTDIRRVSVVFNVAPTMSLVNAAQRGGRVLTPDSENPEKIGTIVEFLHHDRSKRRVQMTYSDVANCACILAKEKGPKHEPGVRPIPVKVTVNGLKVTTQPEEVLQVISSRRPRYLNESFDASALCDDAGRRYKDSVSSSNEQVLKFPVALKMLGKNKWLVDDPKDKLLRTAIEKAQAQIESAFARIDSTPIAPPVVRALTNRNAEIVQHFMRKFENAHFTEGEMAELHDKVERRYVTLRASWSPLKAMAKEHGVTVPLLLLKTDPRLAKGSVYSPAQREFTLTDSESAQVRAVLEERVRPIEKRLLMRWDAFLKCYRDLHKDDQELNGIVEDLKTHGTALAQEYVSRKLVESEDSEDIEQEVALAVMGAIADFKASPNYRFSTLLLQRFASAYNNALVDIDTQMGEFRSDKLVKTLEAVEAYRAEHGRTPDKEELSKIMAIRKLDAAERLGLIQAFREPLRFFSEFDRTDHSNGYSDFSDFDRTADREFNDPNFADSLEDNSEDRDAEQQIMDREILKAGLQALPPHYREFLELHHGLKGEALGVEQLAAKTGRSLFAMRAVLTNAKTKLIEKLRLMDLPNRSRVLEESDLQVKV